MISNEILEIRRMQFEQNAASAPPSEAARKLTAGTIGVASVIVPAAAAGAGEYTVQPGDTLSEIAQDKDTTVGAIDAANPDIIDDVDKIFPGTVLDIPDATQTETPNSQHTVGKGDSLWSIAAAHLGEGASNSAILRLMNELKAGNGDRETIYPGQQIELPGAQKENTGNVYITRPNDSPWSIAQEMVGPAVDTESRRRIRDVANQIIVINGVEVEGRRALLDIGQELKLPLPVGTLTEELPIPKSIPAPAQASAENQKPAEAETIIESDKVTRDFNVPMGEGTPYPDQAAVDSFIADVEEISKKIGVPPNYMMAVFKYETDNTFDPAIKNYAGSGGTGLIQCMARWCAKPLGLTMDEIANMTPNEQLEKVVYPYFAGSAGKLHTLEDTYQRVFYPDAIGKGPDYVIKLDRKGYQQNRGMDANKDGKITAYEVAAPVREIYLNAPIIEAVQSSVQPSDEEVEPTTNAKQNADNKDQSDKPIESTPGSTEVQATYHRFVDISSKAENSDGIVTVRLIDENGNSFGDDISLEIANNAAGLLEAARNAGIRFYIESGARTVKRQEELRVEHGCPGDLVYDRSCKGQPETAVPGNSRHNQGTAIDLRLGLEGDRKLTSGSPEFLWMVQNADDFGFYNLPSESWHWSVDGK